jgi:endogenous inhibitor of DNA gyrase (YacG/DUF329 family)
VECPRCDKPLMWIDDYRAFYCDNCELWFSKYLKRSTREFSEELDFSGRHTPAESFPNMCPYCRAGLPRSSASFCWNCGRSLPTSRESAVVPVKDKKAVRITGKCMVCNLDADSDDTTLWCPHCGNMAHESHRLGWLHVRDYCAACRQHLGETDLRHQPV